MRIYITKDIEINELEKAHLKNLEDTLAKNFQTRESHFHALRGYKGIYVASIPNTNFKGRFIFKKFSGNNLALVYLDTKHSYNNDTLDRLKALEIDINNLTNLDNQPYQQFPTAEDSSNINNDDNPVWVNNSQAKVIKGKITTLTKSQHEVTENICSFFLHDTKHVKFSLVEGVAGSGKTLIIIDAIISLADMNKSFAGKKILYLSPTQRLLDKVKQEIKDVTQGSVPDFIEFKTFEQAQAEWSELNDEARSKFYIIKDECQRDFSVLPKAASYLYIGDDNQVGADPSKDPDFINKVFQSFFQEVAYQYCNDSHFATDMNNKIIKISGNLRSFFQLKDLEAITKYILNAENFKILMQNIANDTVCTYLSNDQELSILSDQKILSKIKIAMLPCIKVIFNKTFLQVSIRCPHDVTKLAESLLKLRESTSSGRKLKSGILSRNNQDSTTSYNNNIRTTDIKNLTTPSVEDAHIVFDDTIKTDLINKGFFNIFSAYDCSGLEYKNIYLHIHARNIQTKSSEATFIAQLYTAMTRSTSTLILDLSFIDSTYTNSINSTISKALALTDHNQSITKKTTRENSKEELFDHAILLSNEGQAEQLNQIVTVMLAQQTQLIKTTVNNINIITNIETTNIQKIQALLAIHYTKIAGNLKEHFVHIIKNCSADELAIIIPDFKDVNLLISVLNEKEYTAILNLPYNIKSVILYNNTFYKTNNNNYNILFASLTDDEKLQLFLSTPTELSKHIFAHEYYKNQNIAKTLIQQSTPQNINKIVIALVSTAEYTLNQIHIFSHQDDLKHKLENFSTFIDNLQLDNVSKQKKQEYASLLLKNLKSDNDLAHLIFFLIDKKIYNLEELYKEISSIPDEEIKNKCNSILLKKILNTPTPDIKQEYFKQLLFSVEFSVVQEIIIHLLNRNKLNLVFQLSSYFLTNNQKEQAFNIRKSIISIIKKYLSNKTITDQEKCSFYKELNDELQTICASNDLEAPLHDEFKKLKEAIKHGNFQSVSNLLNKFKKLIMYQDQTISPDSSLLLIAVKEGKTKIVNILLEQLRNNSIQSNDISRAIELAAEGGHTKIVQLLLNLPQPYNIQSYNISTALESAIEKGYSDMAKILTPHIDQETDDLYSALETAINYNKTIIATYLLSNYTIDFKKERYPKSQLLMTATMNKNIELIKLLLKQPIEIDARDQNNITALMYAKEHNLQDIKKIIETAQKTSSDRYTKLILAALHGNTETAKKLLNHDNIDVNATIEDGSTALIIAAQNGYTGIVKELLLNKYIEINAKTTNGFTALMLAAENNHTETVKELLNHNNIDCNEKTKEQHFTALMLAIRKEHTEIIKELLAHDDIEISAKTRDDITTLEIAKNTGNKEIVSMLENKSKEGGKHMQNVTNSRNSPETTVPGKNL